MCITIQYTYPRCDALTGNFTSTHGGGQYRELGLDRVEPFLFVIEFRMA